MAAARRCRPRRFGREHVGEGSDAGAISCVTTAGTNAGIVSLALRASRRHVNNCCGVSPWRRATADTTAPGASVSSRIRARSSAVQRRRPIAPLITSKRRTSPSGSSLWSSPDTRRSSNRDRQTALSRQTYEGAPRTTLTLGQAPTDHIRLEAPLRRTLSIFPLASSGISGRAETSCGSLYLARRVRQCSITSCEVRDRPFLNTT